MLPGLRRRATAGGGCVSVSDTAAATFEGLLLSDNSAGSEGGAVRSAGQAKMTVSNCTLTKNSATQGGAVWVEMDSVSTVVRSRFLSNSAGLQVRCKGPSPALLCCVYWCAVVYSCAMAYCWAASAAGLRLLLCCVQCWPAACDL